MIIAIVSGAIMVFETARFFQDYKSADFSDFCLYIIATPLALWAGLSATDLNFVLPDGTIESYSGDFYWLYPFFALFLLGLGMCLVSLLYAVRNWKTDNLYPLDIE